MRNGEFHCFVAASERGTQIQKARNTAASLAARNLFRSHSHDDDGDAFDLDCGIVEISVG